MLVGITSKSNGEVAPAVEITATSDSDSDSTPELSDAYALLDARLHKLYAAFPPRTALVIFTGHSDPRRMAALNARKSAFETAIRSGKNPEEVLVDGAKLRWTTADARLLEEEVERAKRGLLFLGIKDAK